MEDGKAFRAETARRLTLTTGPSVWHWTERDYAWPRYYGDYDFTQDTKHREGVRDTLNDAMFALVNAASEPAPPGTPLDSPIIDKEKNKRSEKWTRPWYVPWPYLLSHGKAGSSSDWSFDKLVLMPAILRDAIDALDQAIRAALESAYLRGKQDGGSILLSLAKGTMTLDDFDDAILTREQRADRQKARRGY